MSSLFRFVLNICDDFLASRNILATNQIARTIKPFENYNKRSQGHLGEGGPLNKYAQIAGNQMLTKPQYQVKMTDLEMNESRLRTKHS